MGYIIRLTHALPLTKQCQIIVFGAINLLMAFGTPPNMGKK